MDIYEHAFAAMATVVSMRVIGGASGVESNNARRDAVARAAGWFSQIERSCTRFDHASEIMQLATRVGEPVMVSAPVFEAVRFAVAVAEASGGAFDPTVGGRMAARGYDRHYQTGEAVAMAADMRATADVRSPDGRSDISYRDVHLDVDARTITLARPLVLDVGAVAKGLAVDLAARELAAYDDFAIDAGGDLYLAGRNERGAPWSVAIRHPRATGQAIRTIRVSGRAVCTSGDYERGDHILDARAGSVAPERSSLASVTVLADSAMVADALGTAAFALGAEAGAAFLERQGVDALLVTRELQEITVGDLCREE